MIKIVFGIYGHEGPDRPAYPGSLIRALPVCSQNLWPQEITFYQRTSNTYIKLC